MGLLNRFATQFWTDVVWSLVHSLWQAALLALLLAIVLRRIPARRCDLRYRLALATLGLAVVSTFFTYHWREEMRGATVQHGVGDSFATAVSNRVSNSDTPNMNRGDSHASDPRSRPSLPNPSPGSAAAHGSPVSSDETSPVISGAAGVSKASQRRALIPLLAITWLLGASLMVWRNCVSVWRANRIGPVEPLAAESHGVEHQSSIRDLTNRFQLRIQPKVVLSGESIGPFVVGALSPTVVLPISMMSTLTAEEVRSVLAHEFAHIRRHDYLVNLFQLFLDAVFFFNPAIRWINSQIRVEREACCDRLAVQVATSEIKYATTLANWSETMGGLAAGTAALAFADKQRSGSLIDRVRRIVTPDVAPSVRVSPLTFLFVVAVSLVAASFLSIGTNVTAAIAARVLTNQERVAVIAKEAEQIDFTETEFDAGRGTISIRLVTPNGEPIERGNLYSVSQRTGSSHSTTHRMDGDEFDIQVEAGQVSLHLFSNNFAPRSVEPFPVHKGEQITKEIVLEKGKPVVITVLDDSGSPIRGAKVNLHPEQNSGRVAPVRDWTTDGAGTYVVQHAFPNVLNYLDVTADGFDVFRETRVPTNETNVTLKASPLTKGLVLTEAGIPVANAEVRIFNRSSGNRHYHLDQLLSTTDDAGRFETNRLSSDWIYSLLVTSKSNGRAFKEEVIPGKQAEIRLAPKCTIELTLEGDRSSLQGKKSNEFSLRALQQGGGHHVEVPTKCNEGEGGLVVTLNSLWPGRFRLYARNTILYQGDAKPGKQQVTVDLDALSKSGSQPADKQVVEFRFLTNGQLVQPKGTLLNHSNTKMDVIDGKVRVSLNVDQAYYIADDGMIGFAFDGKHIRVEKQDDGPMQVDIDVEPAGAVSGILVDADGNPVSESVSCNYEAKNDKRYQTGGLHNHFKSDSDGQFLLTPIPLDANVRVVAGERFCVAVSAPIRIDAANPSQKIRLKLPRKTSATVRVVGQDGESLANIPLAVALEYPDVSRSWGGSMLTNAQGVWKTDELGSGLKYRISSDAKKTYQSQSTELKSDGETILRLTRGNVLKGVVLDSDGKPVSSKTVFAYSPDVNSRIENGGYLRADALTDENGEFVFTRLPDAPKVISYTTNAKGPIFYPGKTETLTIRIP